MSEYTNNGIEARKQHYRDSVLRNLLEVQEEQLNDLERILLPEVMVKLREHCKLQNDKIDATKNVEPQVFRGSDLLTWCQNNIK